MQYFQFFRRIVWAIENLTIPFDRARRVVLGTGVEQLEHVPERIWDENSRIW